MADVFTKDLDELFHIASQKQNLVYHLKKNYRENVHYVIERNKFNKRNKNGKQNGGQNKISYMLSETAFELLKNTFNLRNRYIVNVSNSVKCINIGMCIENQTIGFIENSFNSVLKVKRQHTIGKYRVDLYFIDYKLAIECDENNHDDRDATDERIREEYILSLGNKMIRYNPNEPNFDLSNVLKQINVLLFK